MFIAEFELSHPKLVLSRTISQVPEMDIELDYQLIADPGSYYLFFEVSGGSFEAFDATVEDDPTVAESTVVVDAGESRVYRMRLLELDHLVLPRAAALGMRVLFAVSGERGWEATLQVPDTSALQEFRSYYAVRDIQFTVNRLYRAEEGADAEAFGLTPIQRETLLAAYRSGYFNEPRDASLQDVADRLDISSSAASGRLRRAIAALVENTVAAE